MFSERSLPSSLLNQVCLVPRVLSSSSFLFYLVHRYDDFLCNEESKTSVEDLTCYRTFTALHWKRDVSKEPFQLILKTSYQSISSIGVSAVINGRAKRLLLQTGAKKARHRRPHDPHPHPHRCFRAHSNCKRTYRKYIIYSFYSLAKTCRYLHRLHRHLGTVKLC